jgi:hypothetical protein
MRQQDLDRLDVAGFMTEFGAMNDTAISLEALDALLGAFVVSGNRLRNVY